MASFEMYRGDSFIIDVAVVDSLGVAYDLTSCKLWFTAKTSKSLADVDATIVKDTDANGFTVTDAAGGIADVEILPADTDALVGASTLYYDIQLKDVNNRIFTLSTGTISILEDVTRDAV